MSETTTEVRNHHQARPALPPPKRSAANVPYDGGAEGDDPPSVEVSEVRTGEEPSPEPQMGEESPRGKRPLHHRPAPLVIFALVFLGAVAGGGYFYLFSRMYVETENAFLEGDVIQIAPRISGSIATVLVEENDTVEEGQILARIDPAPYRIALQQSRAQGQSAAARLRRAKAQLAVARANVEQAEAQVQVAQSDRENALADLKRYRRAAQAISEEMIDDAEARLDQTTAELTATRTRVAGAVAEVAAAQAEIETARANIAQAEARAERAQLDLSYTKLTAPTSGEIAMLNVEAGEYVQPGRALMALVPPRAWIKANFKETQITYMRPGQAVTIHIDAYPNRSFHGSVESIQRGTGAEFSLLPPQNATGNFIKVVQRVPVKIVFNEPPQVPSLAPGLSVVPTVKVREWDWWPWWPPGEQEVASGAMSRRDPRWEE